VASDECKTFERMISLIVDAERPIQTRNCGGLHHLISPTDHTNRTIFADHIPIRQSSEANNRDFTSLASAVPGV
jgi:hypothetical protein